MGYENLMAIYSEAKSLAERDEFEAPTECPNDGTTLIRKGDGTLFCRFDGWVWNGSNTGNEV